MGFFQWSSFLAIWILTPLKDSSKKYTWSAWSDWSSCSNKCGTGITKRLRTCQTTNKLAQIQNVSLSVCTKNRKDLSETVAVEEKLCETSSASCNNNKQQNTRVSQWSEWSAWSACTNECLQYKKRFCHDGKNNRVSSCSGESFLTRSCDKQNCQLLAKLTSTTISYRETERHALSKFDARLFVAGLGLAGFLVFIFILIALFFIVCKFKRRKRRHRNDDDASKSDLNLYYTCERQKLPIEDECSMFKFLKTSESSSSTSSSGVSSSLVQNKHYDTPSHNNNNNNNNKNHHQSGIYANMYEYNDVGRNYLHHPHHMHNTILVEQQQHLLSNKTYQHSNTFIPIQNLNEYQMQSPKETQIVFSPSAFKPVKNNSISNTTPTSGSSSSSSSNQNTPGYSSCMTKSIILSSTSPSTNTYYSPHHSNLVLPSGGCGGGVTAIAKADAFKIISINNVPTLVRANFDGNTDFNYNVPVDISSEKVLIRKSSLVSVPQQQQNFKQQIKNQYHVEELAYDIADPLGIKLNFLSDNKYNLDSTPNTSKNFILAEKIEEKISVKHIDSIDMCVAMVNAAGATLSLDCGVTLLIPEGAIGSEQKITIYLGICREESFKPKLNDKSTLLSEIITIGSTSNLTLLKPVILSLEHNCKNLNQDWNLNLYSSFNSHDLTPDWTEDLSIASENNRNLDMFVNTTDTHFLLMTDKLGRYALTGEANNLMRNKASKIFRLVTFFSSSLTNKEFNLRVYIIDNLNWALQEVLRDEGKIGGALLETSDPFLISYTNSNEFLSLHIENFNPDAFNCKYNVTCQDIPLSHIWNGRNHLLHCSFTFERVNDSPPSQQLDCTIRTYFKSSSSSVDLNIKLNLKHNLENLTHSSGQKESIEFLSKGLKNWKTSNSIINSPHQLITPQNMPKKYFKIDKCLKSEICGLLDDTFSREKNWKTLASKLGINRNLHYFASKSSPTEHLLSYFEAISDLKSNDYIRKNIELAAQSNNGEYSLSMQESLFHKFFLSCLIQAINTNEDLKNLIYNDNLIS